MVEPLSRHPAADTQTDEALVVHQDRRVVGLSAWLADAAVAAVTSSRLFQLLTPVTSRITYPLEVFLSTGGCQWIVRDEQVKTGFRDGFTGMPMSWTGARFEVAGGEVPPVEPVSAGSGSIEVHAVVPHPAAESVELGGSALAIVRALTGAEPLGWGVAEPATQPWSQRELTAACRTRAPAPTSLVVVGDGAWGTLRVERVGAGLVERCRFAGPDSRSVARATMHALAGELATSARSMLVAVHPRRLAGSRPPTPSPPALPYAVLVGSPVVRDGGLAHARATPAVEVDVLGPADRPACWCRLNGGERAPFEVLTDVLRHFGLPAIDTPAGFPD